MKKILITLLLITSASLYAADVPLKVPHPKPRLIGTQVAVNIGNLDRSDGLPAESIKVPENAKNIALNKPVTSSDPAPIIGELELVTDGEIDAEEGYYVELDVNQQWVQIDLEKPSTIYAIVVWHFYSQARAYKDVVIQISDDPEFKKDVTTVFNNDEDNTAKLGKGDDKHYIDTHKGRIFPVKAVKGRYVRLYSSGNTANQNNHYIEVQVIGTQQ